MGHRDLARRPSRCPRAATRFASRLRPAVSSARAASRNGVRALPTTAGLVGQPFGFAGRHGDLVGRQGITRRAPDCTAAAVEPVPSASERAHHRRGLGGRVDPMLQIDRRLAREEERQPAHPESHDRDTQLLELLRRRDRIDDRLRTRADEQPGRTRELEQIGTDVDLFARMHAADAAGRSDARSPPSRPAQIVALTVVAPSAPVRDGDRHVAAGHLRRSTGFAEPRSSSSSSPTTTAPSTTPIQAGTAPASRIASPMRRMHSSLRGGRQALTDHAGLERDDAAARRRARRAPRSAT